MLSGLEVFPLICIPWTLLLQIKFPTINRKGELLSGLLSDLASDLPVEGRVKGKGLLIGLELDLPEDQTGAIFSEILGGCREKGLLILKSGTSVIRIAPPLVITEDELRTGVNILKNVLKEIL